MYYEVYIDVLFMVNLVMDFFILLIMRKILKYTATYFRILLGSMAGALGMCLLFLFPPTYPLVRIILIHGIINGIMVVVGLKIRSRKEFIKSMGLLYLVTFLAGGIFDFLYQQTILGDFYSDYILGNSRKAIGIRSFLFFTAASYIIINIGLKAYEYYKAKYKYVYRVVVCHQKREIDIMGLLDTGNSLKDPISRKPVSIIQYQYMKPLLEEETAEFLTEFYHGNIREFNSIDKGISKILYIPYHSIGKKHGILPAIIADKLYIHTEEKTVELKNQIIGICEEPVTGKKSYQMILNPEIVNN